MESLTGASFTVAVHLMSEPCLWRWEIRNPARDEVVANSWTQEWMAYESSDDAFQAGHVQLASLTRPEHERPASAARRPLHGSV